MTKRMRWLAGLAIVLAMFCVGIARYRPAGAVDERSLEPTRGAAAKSAPTLSDILAPIALGETGEGDPQDLPRVRLEGIAITATQQPIAGATVRLGTRTTVSDIDGSFAFEEVAQERVVIVAERGELYGEQGRHFSDGSDPIEVTLRAGPTLTVHVVADKTGAPIVGASVDTSDREGITDTTGTVRLRSLESHDETVWVKAPGFADHRDRVVGDEAQPRAPMETTIRMKSGAPIRGYVVTPTGERLRDATVRVSFEMHSTSVSTDERGNFEIPNVPAGILQITAMSDAYLRAKEQELEHDGEHALEGVKVTVIAGAELGGLVVDQGGNPVEGASIYGANASTGPDGRFLARGLGEGAVEVRAYVDGRSSPTTIVDVSRKQRAEVRLVLVHTEISGVVVDHKGQPVMEATVYATATGESSSTSFATTDEYGTFVLGGIPPGEYELRAQFAEESNRPMSDNTAPGQRVSSGAARVRIVLRPLATVAGRVTMDGAPVTYFGVSIVPRDSHAERTLLVTDESGVFSQTNIAAGSYVVTVAGPDFATWKKDISVDAGSVLDLGTIAVTRGRIVQGRVTHANGSPVAGATVIAAVILAYVDASKVNQRLNGTTTAITDASGAYTLVGVPREDTLAIGAKLPNGRDTLEKRLEPVDTIVDLVVPEVGTLEGVVTTENRERLFLYSRTTGYSALIDVDAAGTFSQSNVPVDVYELGPSSRSEEFITVTVEANRTTTVSY